MSLDREHLARLALEALNARIEQRRDRITGLEGERADIEHEIDVLRQSIEIIADERNEIHAELGIDTGPDPLFPPEGQP